MANEPLTQLQPDLFLLLRLVLAALLTGVLGWERQSAGKAAGLRTHMVLGVGAALFAVLGEVIVNHYPHAIAQAQFDPTRVIHAIATGVGFLGAGTIFVSRGAHRVSGLTTAASIWASAAVGLTAGFGYFILASGATAILFVLLRLGFEIEDRWLRAEPEGASGREDR